MLRSNKTILFIIILLHVIWLAAGLSWKHFYNGDSYEYIYLAESISKGHYYGANPVMPVIDYRLSSRTPAYPAFLLLCYTLFGKSNLAVLLIQNLLSIASCFLIWKTFQRMDGIKKYSWLYLLFLAFYPAQMFFATTLAPDTLLQFFMILYFRQLFLSLYEKSPVRIGYMSLWLVLAAMAKPVIYPFVFLHFIFAMWYSFRSKSKMVLFTGVIPILMLMGYGFWNKERTGLFHISSIQSNNLLNYNAKAFLAKKKGQPFADSTVQSIKANMEHMPGLKQKYEYASGEATAIIKSDLPGYAFFHLRESIRFFVEPGKSELDLFTGFLGYDFDPKAPNFYKSYKQDGIRGAWNYLKTYPWLPLVLLVFLFNLVRILGAILFFFNKKIPLAVRIICTIYILYFAAVTGPVANTRYFLPVLLVMSAMATVGYADWWERVKIKRKHLT